MTDFPFDADDTALTFQGFSEPQKNFSELPHELIAALPIFDSLAELKIVLYVLRHTWGYHEYAEGKHITLDEFEHGRKYTSPGRYGQRMDGGVGMVKQSIISGLKRAIEHGFLSVETDDADRGRIDKWYQLQMSKSWTPEVQELDPRGPEVRHRTKKQTIETNYRNSMRESLSLSRGVNSGDANTGEVSGESGNGQADNPTSKEFGTSPYTQAHPTPSKVPLKVSPPDYDPLGDEIDSAPLSPMAQKAKAKQASKRLSGKPALPPTYGDLFVAIRAEVYGATAVSGKQLSLRAGQDAKTLLADFPDATAAEFMDFVKEYKARQGGMTLPRNGNLAVWFDTYRREWKKPPKPNVIYRAIEPDMYEAKRNVT